MEPVQHGQYGFARRSTVGCKNKIRSRALLLAALAVGILIVVTTSAAITCPSEQCKFTGSGIVGEVVRVTINSISNAGVALQIGGAPKWAVATVYKGGEFPSSYFTIYNDQLGRNALVIDTMSNGIAAGGAIYPGDDNVFSLGNSGRRWTAVYAKNGTIQTSDARYKTDIANLGYGLSEVMKLNPVTFRWKDELGGNLQLGLIGQEVDSVIPEVVAKGKSPEEPLGMSYAGLIPVLIKAIQEQQKLLESKDAEILKMQQQLDALQVRLEMVESLIQKLQSQPR